MESIRDFVVILATLICLLALVRVASAAPNPDDPFLPANQLNLSKTRSQTEETKVTLKDPWLWVDLDAQHFWDHNSEVNSLTLFHLESQWQIDNRRRVQLVLPSTQYFISKDRSRFELDDTYLYLSTRVSKNHHVFVRTGFTLPTARSDSRQGLWTSPNLQVLFSESFFNNRLKLSAAPFAVHSIGQKYSLLNFSLGASIQAAYLIADRLYSELTLATVSHLGNYPLNRNRNTDYSASVALNYFWDSWLSSQLGVYRGNSYLPDGRLERTRLNFDSTRVYLALQFHFQA